MNKTISVMAYNRPNKLKKCINRLKKAKGIENWDVYGFADFSQSRDGEKVREILYKEDLFQNICLYTNNHGIRKANIRTLDYMFEFSDYNLHVEEDLLLGPDSLKFLESCIPKMDDKNYKYRSITLWTHPSINKQSNRIHGSQRFSCWAWLTSKYNYKKHFKKAFDQYYYDDSWACSVSDYYEDNDFYELFPEMSRCKNIGFDSGYHDGSDNSLQDKPDKWTGGKFTPTYDNLFCSDSNCEVAIKHQEGG